MKRQYLLVTNYTIYRYQPPVRLGDPDLLYSLIFPKQLGISSNTLLQHTVDAFLFLLRWLRGLLPDRIGHHILMIWRVRLD